MTTAHRTSGAAPLAVFFDAVDDVAQSSPKYTFAWTSSVYQPIDYEGTTYTWDFGDPGSGTWSTTGKSRNTATGYTAAHVYESPGIYTVILTQTDTSGTVRTYTQQITVTAFSGDTRYVASGGTGDGTSESSPWGSLSTGMAWVTGGSNRRLLLHRGDTFTLSQAYAITTPGPGIIGAYGTGTKPLLLVPDLGDANAISPRGAGVDWRIMDIEFRGPSADQSSWTGSVGPPPDVQGVNSLFLRLSFDRWNVGIGWSLWSGPAAGTPHDGMFIVDCEAWNHYNVGIYAGGRRLALLGNYDHDGLATHLARIWQAHKAVVSNNAFLRPGGQRHCLKLHGAEPNFPTAPETRWVSISDNTFAASNTSQWTVSMGSQSSDPSEAANVTHVLFERNRFTASPSTVVALQSEARSVIIRNNIFDDTDSPAMVGIYYSQRNAAIPAPNDVRIYNNTAYKGSTSSDVAGFLQTDSGVTNLRVRNNLYHAASLTNTQMIWGSGGSGWAQDHNLLTAAAASSVFTNAAGGDFSLVAGSPAANAGVTLPEVLMDYAGANRPVGSAFDIGAYEYVPGVTPPAAPTGLTVQ